MQSNLELKITAKTRIAKFNEDQNPEVDEPFEVVEQEVVLTGDKAKKLMEQLGGVENGPN